MSIKRILHVVTTMDYGGVETLIMSIYRGIDRSKIQFDFLCHNSIDNKYTNEILNMGGRMFMIPGPKHIGILKYEKKLYDFFLNHSEYQIVHVHLNQRNGEILKVAKKAGVPIRISHCHVANPNQSIAMKLYYKYFSYVNRKVLTHAFACSDKAGDWLYGKKIKYRIISNAISVENFCFNLNERKYIRDKYNIEKTEFLLGHVGRFDNAKNHDFILRVFDDISKKNSNKFKLMLIGTGYNEEEIKNQAKRLKLFSKIIFVGESNNLGKYYSAMDLFLFPSIYEGFGIVAVEAQCSGLMVLASNTVPNEVKITENVKFMSLADPIDNWSKYICEYVNIYDPSNREKYYNIVKESNYNINRLALELQNFYLKVI